MKSFKNLSKMDVSSLHLRLRSDLDTAARALVEAASWILVDFCCEVFGLLQ